MLIIRCYSEKGQNVPKKFRDMLLRRMFSRLFMALLRRDVGVGMGRLSLSLLVFVPGLLSFAFVTASASAQHGASPVQEGVINPFHPPSDSISRSDSTLGAVQPFHLSDIPSWMTLDMQLRGRTEEQTSLGYVSGKDRLYELSRVWGGITVHPTEWLTGYAQFMDLHALGCHCRIQQPTCAIPSICGRVTSTSMTRRSS
jgi:hypothetical protein